jgi:hypothetical protein
MEVMGGVRVEGLFSLTLYLSQTDVVLFPSSHRSLFSSTPSTSLNNVFFHCSNRPHCFFVRFSFRGVGCFFVWSAHEWTGKRALASFDVEVANVVF